MLSPTKTARMSSMTSPIISPLAPRQLSDIRGTAQQRPSLSSKFAASQSSNRFTSTAFYQSGHCQKTFLDKENRSPLGPLKNPSRSFAPSNVKCPDIENTTRKKATVTTTKKFSSKSPSFQNISSRIAISNTPRNSAAFETPKTISHYATARKRKMSIHGVMSIKRNWETQKQREKSNLENNFELAQNLSLLVENYHPLGGRNGSDSDDNSSVGFPTCSGNEQYSPIAFGDYFASPNSREQELMDENKKLRLRINDLVTARNSLQDESCELSRKLQTKEAESMELKDRLEKSESRCNKLMKSMKERSSNQNELMNIIDDVKKFLGDINPDGRSGTRHLSECEPDLSQACSNGPQFNLYEHKTELLQIMGLTETQNSSLPEATPDVQKLREKYDNLMAKMKEVEGKLAFAEADVERSARYYEYCLAEQIEAHDNEIATHHETINSLMNKKTSLQLVLRRVYGTQSNEIEVGSIESTEDGPNLFENQDCSNDDKDTSGASIALTFHSDLSVESECMESPIEGNDRTHQGLDCGGRESFDSEATESLPEGIKAKMIADDQAAMDDSFNSYNSNGMENNEFRDCATHFGENCGQEYDNDSWEESHEERVEVYSLDTAYLGSVIRTRNIDQSPISESPTQRRISRVSATNNAPPTSSQIEVVDLTGLIGQNDRVRVLLDTPDMFGSRFEEWHEGIITKVAIKHDSPSAFEIVVQYEDGVEDTCIFPSNEVQLIEDMTEESDAVVFSVGDLVQCRTGDGAYGGGWYRGRIASISSDGKTCDVMYYTNQMYESNVPINVKNVKLVSRDCCGEWLIDQKVRRTRDNGCDEFGIVKEVEINDRGKFGIVDFDGGERYWMRFDEAAKAAFECLLETYSNDTKLQWPVSTSKYNNRNYSKKKRKKSREAPSKSKRKNTKQVDTGNNSRELPRRERRKPDYFTSASS